MDELEDAAADFESAQKYNPDDLQIRDNLAEVLASIGPQSAESAMAQGLSRFERGNYLGAKQLFTSILNFGDLSAAKTSKVLANRAACHLALEEYGTAIGDCDNGIRIICNCSDIGQIEDQILSESPEELRIWLGKQILEVEGGLCRLFCRKGSILGHEKQYGLAIKQYECAKQVDRLYNCGDHEELINEDISKMKNLMLLEASV